MGPTNPEEAKQAQPDWWVYSLNYFTCITLCVSLRALFGEDLTKNAVHGSSDPDKAKDAIKMIFGDIPLGSEDPPAEGMESYVDFHHSDHLNTVAGDEVPADDNPPAQAEATGTYTNTL